MKILLISDFFPNPNIPGGASARVYYLLRELAKKHSVDLLSTQWPGLNINSWELKDICNNVYFYKFVEEHGEGRVSNKIAERLIELRHFLFENTHMVQATLRHKEAFQKKLNDINIGSYDLIQIEDSCIAYRLFDIKKKYPSVPIVVDLHNVNSLIEKRNFELATGWRWRLYKWAEWKKMVNYEAKVFGAFNLNLTCSDQDKNVGLKMTPDAGFETIPNGVDTEYFKPNFKFEPNTLVFLGSDWAPNVDGLLYFYREMWPVIKNNVPDAKLYIVGNFNNNERIMALAGGDIILTGYVKDVREWICKGAVFVIPLRLGGGTRLKLVEAMSSGKAIVSTSMGAEGIDVSDNKDILLRDDPRSFSDAVIGLLKNDSERARLGINARRLAEKKYDWNIIGRKLNNVYAELVNYAER